MKANEITNENVFVELKPTKNDFSFDEPDWETLRIQMASSFMANMLNSDETFRTKIVSDLLYKEVAAFAVKCADALIEELKK